MEPLVDVGWLAAHLADPDIVVLDCSVVIDMGAEGMSITSGRGPFDERHIPGAAFADLLVDLSDTEQPIGFAVPAPAAFCEAMGRLGVGDGKRVVLYDTAGSMWASRVWWMLRWVGFDAAAVLDGGLAAWTAAGHPLASEPSAPTAAEFTPHLRPGLIADCDEVLAAIADDDVRLIDTLPEAHFRGEMSLYERPGHIPGAESIPMFEVVGDSGRVATVDEVVATHGDDLDRRAITYCGGGIAASLTAFAMVRAGYSDVAVYTASLQEWAADPALPLVTD
ncbi:sulfurtransferase [Ilumatobacter sp.]|uniref:sulfurtransferase n=1 Tax=Ilumatobacter sp. TaxID=1967498 RepID=UPI003AF9B44F